MSKVRGLGAGEVEGPRWGRAFRRRVGIFVLPGKHVNKPWQLTRGEASLREEQLRVGPGGQGARRAVEGSQQPGETTARPGLLSELGRVRSR